jgi:multidrug efflux system membrane fusion protein
MSAANPALSSFPSLARRALLIALPVAAVATALAAVGGSGTHAPESQVAPTEVTVAEVLHRPLHDWQEFSGRLQAVNTVELRPRVSGYVDSVAFPDGARVSKGQLLFQIDPRPFQAEVSRLQADRARAVSDLKLAETTLARGERLIGSNAISREEFDRLSAAATSARGQLDSISAALEAARLNREFTEVRAPIDGRASRALITQGNLVTSESLLTTVVSDNPVYAYFDADERTYLRFAHLAAQGDHGSGGVYMGLVDENGYPHQGRLDFVDNQVDPGTGTIRARAVFENSDRHFTPGLFARVRLVGNESPDTVLIEERAVGTDLSRKYVLVVGADDVIDTRFVELGPQIDGLRVIRKGLKPGEVIVVNGLQRVKPGERVAPRRVAMSTGGDELRQVASPTQLAAGAAANGRAQP